MFLGCITQDMATILSSNVVAYLPKDVYLAKGSAVALYFGDRLSVDLIVHRFPALRDLRQGSTVKGYPDKIADCIGIAFFCRYPYLRLDADIIAMKSTFFYDQSKTDFTHGISSLRLLTNFLSAVHNSDSISFATAI